MEGRGMNFRSNMKCYRMAEHCFPDLGKRFYSGRDLEITEMRRWLLKKLSKNKDLRKTAQTHDWPEFLLEHGAAVGQID